MKIYNFSNKNFLAKSFSSKGFSLLEMIIVIAIITILASLAIPSYKSMWRLIDKATCILNQRHIRDAVLVYYSDRPFVTDEDGFGDGEVFIDLKGRVVGDPSRNLSDLIGDKVFDCPSDGLAKDGEDSYPDYITDGMVVTCINDNSTANKYGGIPFIHDIARDVYYRHSITSAAALSLALPSHEDVEEEVVVEEEEPPPPPLTSLGSTFDEIVSSMVILIENFYDDNGRYPRSWGDYVYTDIGLDPDEWEKAYDGIIYNPGGNRIKVTPDDGYIFYVTGIDGSEKVLKSNYNWSLWYSMEDRKWYYHKIKDKNEIDISTLRIEK